MKRYLFLFFAVMCSLTSMTQEQDPWIGTWTSESYRDMDWEESPKDSEGDFVDIIKTDYKLVIRITKKGDSYNVRAKTIKVKDPAYSLYHDPLTVRRIAGNTMWLESYRKKVPFTVDRGYGPKIDSYSDNTYYYKITLNNGVLHYSYYKVYSVDYDANMRYKGEETLNARDFNGAELDLYNDDW